MHSLLEHVKITKLKNYTSNAGDVTSDTLTASAGVRSIVFLTGVSNQSTDADGSLIVSQSTDGTNWDALDTIALDAGEDNKLYLQEIVKPLATQGKYFKVVYDQSAGTAVVDHMQAIEFMPKTLPASNPSSVEQTVVSVSPD